MESKDEYPRDMQKALEKFRCEAEQIIGRDSPFVKSMTSQKPPVSIYHYTNDTGLKGILEHGTLWLSDISSLNDPSELKHGFEIAIKELEKMVADGPPESREFAKDLRSVDIKKKIHEAANFFICSFSLCGDDLGQWRAYADDGHGFVLEFDASALENEFAPDSFPLTYNDKKLAEIDRQIIAKMLHLSYLPTIKDNLSIAFMIYTTNAAIYFKHPAYKNEMEYRFLEAFSIDAQPCVNWKPRRYSLIKYREYDWRSIASGALKRIIVGPAADQRKASQFAEKCLHLFPKYGNVPIDYSSIPYRSR
ncbi:MAG: DUF2971 domain-containing protein [Terracidiphilus sp.]|jgi:hypothetical protein